MTIQGHTHPEDRADARRVHQHRSRATAATDRSIADLAAQVATDPTMRDRLTPGQLIALGMRESALESRQWLRDHNLADDDQTEEMP